MKKIDLNAFIKRNERLILVFGIFLVILPLSFDTIKDFNQNYAGVLAIATSIILILIIKNFLWGHEEESLSFETIIFVLSMLAIAFSIGLVTFQVYTSLTLTFIDYVLYGIYAFFGAFLAFKLSQVEMKKVVYLKHILFIILTLAILFSNAEITLPFYLFITSNFGQIPYFNEAYLNVFFGGFSLIIIFYGIFESGFNFFIKKQLYEKNLKKHVEKIKKNYAKTIKNLRDY